MGHYVTSLEARIAEYAVAPTPPSPPPSPLSTWSTPISQIPLPTATPPIINYHLPPPVTQAFTVNHHHHYTTFSLTIHTLPAPTSYGKDHSEAELPLVRRFMSVCSHIDRLESRSRESRRSAMALGNWLILGRTQQRLLKEEQDTQDVYVVIEDTQDRQTQLFQSVDGLVEDRQFHYETATIDSYPDARFPYRITGVHDDDIDLHMFHMQGLFSASIGKNNMPPRRSSATARADCACWLPAGKGYDDTPFMTVLLLLNSLIKARVSAALANHETLRNNTNGQGDKSHNSDTGIRGTVRTPRMGWGGEGVRGKTVEYKSRGRDSLAAVRGDDSKRSRGWESKGENEGREEKEEEFAGEEREVRGVENEEVARRRRGMRKRKEREGYGERKTEAAEGVEREREKRVRRSFKDGLEESRSSSAEEGEENSEKQR
ncbi:hypothetical protein Tco_1105198 [Tanacetum coccineum]